MQSIDGRRIRLVSRDHTHEWEMMPKKSDEGRKILETIVKNQAFQTCLLAMFLLQLYKELNNQPL